MKPVIEVCAGSYEDCLAVQKAGIKRVELNSALALGGLSPTTATLKEVKKDTDLEVVCMVRGRAAGFCYTDAETEIMFLEAREFLENGADGIAFGFLTETGQVDGKKTRAMVDLIHSYGKTAVFHRAIDVTKDLDAAMEMLVQSGVDRVLTSGQQKSAMQGRETIAHLQQTYGDSIQILAGSGVNAGNARELLQATGIHQIHSSCKDWKEDPTTQSQQVSFSYAQNPLAYEVVSEQLAKALKDSLDGMEM